MPTKPAAKKAEVAIPAATNEPSGPPDYGPNINPYIPKILGVFKLFDPERTMYMPTSDVLTLLHSLGIFATPAEFQTDILPFLGSAGEPVARVPYEKLEAKIISLLSSHSYLPPSGAELTAAFRTLDKEKSGNLTVDALRRALTNPNTRDALTLTEFDAFCGTLQKVSVPEGEKEMLSYAAYARALEGVGR